IKDPAKLAAYAKLAPLALAAFGVRYLCRGNPNATYESGLKERLVVSEFPSLEKAIAGHDSPGYQEALRALGDGAVRDIRIIEGLEYATPPVHSRSLAAKPKRLRFGEAGSGNPSGSPLSAYALRASADSNS